MSTDGWRSAVVRSASRRRAPARPRIARGRCRREPNRRCPNDRFPWRRRARRTGGRRPGRIWSAVTSAGNADAVSAISRAMRSNRLASRWSFWFFSSGPTPISETVNEPPHELVDTRTTTPTYDIGIRNPGIGIDPSSRSTVPSLQPSPASVRRSSSASDARCEPRGAAGCSRRRRGGFHIRAMRYDRASRRLRRIMGR